MCRGDSLSFRMDLFETSYVPFNSDSGSDWVDYEAWTAQYDEVVDKTHVCSGVRIWHRRTHANRVYICIAWNSDSLAAIRYPHITVAYGIAATDDELELLEEKLDELNWKLWAPDWWSHVAFRRDSMTCHLPIKFTCAMVQDFLLPAHRVAHGGRLPCHDSLEYDLLARSHVSW